MISRRGVEEAVLVPIAEWKRLQSAAHPSLKSLLLNDEWRADLVPPKRGAGRRRLPVSL
jgi:PHD/YefM family antitoxin component YafN of YafNO toxin-antitoxin module